MIQVTNLSKKYGSHVAVDNVSFTINDGEILGFLGPNGAGKSTTMNIVTGYLSATAGSVSIDGYDILSKVSFDVDTLVEQIQKRTTKNFEDYYRKR